MDEVLVFVGEAAFGFDHADVAGGFIACHYGHGYVHENDIETSGSLAECFES